MEKAMAVADYTIFERNMLAISSSFSRNTAKRIREAPTCTRLTIESSRSGQPVPHLHRNNRNYALHSRFDPVSEASKIAEGYAHHGFFVFLGLGAGYGIIPFLENNQVSRGIIIEFDAGLVRALFEQIDLTNILADRRLDLIVDPEPEELQELFVSAYIPSLYGNFSLVPLRGRVDEDRENFQLASDHLKLLMEAVSDDYSVQAFFGKRWFANIISNLRRADGSTPPVGPIQRAAITAAGPSLELYIDTLRNRSPNTFLIATDTSLNVLLSHDIIPNAVITIDCQHISYFHFMKGVPEGVPVFLDLATPPTVARLSGGSYFFSSGHPLARYVASGFRAFPLIDTSGGNVTHAAVSLADFLGARQIDLYGADFSYPAGKAYARGSYVYPYFDIRQKRLTPLESLFSHFLFRNQSMDRQADNTGNIRYITKPLVAYRERLERLAKDSAAQLIPHSGNGMPIAVPSHFTVRQDFGKVFAAGRMFRKAREFMENYHQDLSQLSLPASPAGLYMGSLGAHERDIWMTMLPSAAAIRREQQDTSLPPEEILGKTRLWCLQKVEEALDSWQEL